MTERAAFESWVKGEWPVADLTRSDIDDEYIVNSIQRYWIGWQACAQEIASETKERE